MTDEESLRKLFRAVILRMTQDLISNDIKLREEALIWFNVENEDFLESCLYADMEPKMTVEKALNYAQRISNQ